MEHEIVEDSTNKNVKTPKLQCPKCGAPLEYDTVKLYADGAAWEERPFVECKHCGFIKELYK